MVAAPFGLAITDKATAAEVAKEIGKARRPSVIWLHFQDCTGCTETLLRTSKPDLADLILQVISLDYHETLMAASLPSRANVADDLRSPDDPSQIVADRRRCRQYFNSLTGLV